MWSILMNAIGLITKDIDDIFYELSDDYSTWLEGEFTDILSNFDGSKEDVKTSVISPLLSNSNGLTRPSTDIPCVQSNTVDCSGGDQVALVVGAGVRIIAIGVAADDSNCYLYNGASQLVSMADGAVNQSLSFVMSPTPTSFHAVKDFGNVILSGSGFGITASATGYVNVTVVYMQPIGESAKVTKP